MPTSDPVYAGRGATIGLVAESTWGTAVNPRTNWLRLISCSLATKRTYSPIPDLGYSGQVSPNVRRNFATMEESGGDIEWVGSYDDSTQFLLHHALGATADAGAGPYTHTSTLKTDLGEGFTCEFIRGELPASTAISEVFEGCMISRLEMSWKAGDVMRCRASIIAETSAARGAAGSPTYSSNGEPVLHYQAGVFTWNAVARKLRELTITVDNSLDRRPYLGSLDTQRPQRSGPMSVTARAVLEIFTGDALYAGHLAQTQSDATITFTSGAKSMAFTLHNAEIISVDDPISSAGVLTQTVEFRCLSDGTDQGLRVVTTNANALYSAN